MIKVYRDEPEFAGGPLTAEIPESSLEEARNNGWKVADKAKGTEGQKTEPAKPAEPKVEPKAAKTKKKLD